MRGSLVLVANATRAKLYHAVADGLTRLEEIDFPEGGLRDSDLGTDRPGRTFMDGPGPQRSAYESERSAHRTKLAQFAHQLSEAVHRVVVANPELELVVVAPAQMVGEIKAAIDDQVRKHLVHTISHDYTRLPDAQLKEALRNVGIRGLFPQPVTP